MKTQRMLVLLTGMLLLLNLQPVRANQSTRKNINRRLNLKQIALIKSVGGLADQMVADSNDMFTTAQVEHMFNSLDRANRSRKRFFQAGGYVKTDMGIGTLRELEGALDDAINAIDETLFLLQDRAEQEAVMKENGMTANPNDKCAKILQDGILHSKAVRIAEAEVLVAVQWLYDDCQARTGATRAASGCHGRALALAVARALYEGYVIYQEMTYQERLCDCLAYMSRNIDDLSDRMEERFDEVVKLLNTPHGQRPTFPEKD